MSYRESRKLKQQRKRKRRATRELDAAMCSSETTSPSILPIFEDETRSSAKALRIEYHRQKRQETKDRKARRRAMLERNSEEALQPPEACSITDEQNVSGHEAPTKYSIPGANHAVNNMSMRKIRQRRVLKTIRQQSPKATEPQPILPAGQVKPRSVLSSGWHTGVLNAFESRKNKDEKIKLALNIYERWKDGRRKTRAELTKMLQSVQHEQLRTIKPMKEEGARTKTHPRGPELTASVRKLLGL